MQTLEFPRGSTAAILPRPAVTNVGLAPILIADDDPDDLFFALRLIKRTGTKHPVITFDDGAGVADFLRGVCLVPSVEWQLMPRLLFLDLKMAGLGGFGFLEWAHQQAELAPLNIIVLSGSDEPKDIARAKRLGAKRYLVKHPSSATFTTIVHNVYPPSAN